MTAGTPLDRTHGSLHPPPQVKRSLSMALAQVTLTNIILGRVSNGSVDRSAVSPPGIYESILDTIVQLSFLPVHGEMERNAP